MVGSKAFSNGRNDGPCILGEGSGIVAIRNLKTDKVYLFYSSDVKGDCVKNRFKLDLGMHECRSLQEDYTNTGLEVFRFDVLEYTNDPARLEVLRSETSNLYE